MNNISDKVVVSTISNDALENSKNLIVLKQCKKPKIMRLNLFKKEEEFLCHTIIIKAMIKPKKIMQ